MQPPSDYLDAGLVVGSYQCTLFQWYKQFLWNDYEQASSFYTTYEHSFLTR